MNHPVFKIVLFLGILFACVASPLHAAVEVHVSSVNFEAVPPQEYDVSAIVTNNTGEPREVILRFQLFFFEKDGPAGDVPAMILRQDKTVILKPAESGRSITVRLRNEGNFPRARLRMEPEVRIRRQRVWNY